MRYRRSNSARVVVDLPFAVAETIAQIEQIPFELIPSRGSRKPESVARAGA